MIWIKRYKVLPLHCEDCRCRNCARIPIVGRWVIIATERAKRPVAPEERTAARRRASVPSAKATRTRRRTKSSPTAIAHTRSNEKGWRVRVVPNKFPALQIEGDLNKRGEGIYDKMNGIGAHEVIIECPVHEISMANLAEENIREILWVYRDRLVDLKKDPRLVYGMVFKNVGAAAGASLEHSHSQLIVTPIVPINVLGGDERLAGVFQLSRPLHLLRHDPSGIAVREADCTGHAQFRRLLPLRRAASPSRRGSCPRHHNSHFENIQKNEVDELGTVLKTILLKLEAGAGQAGLQLHHPHVARSTRSPCPIITGTWRLFRV